MRITPIIILSFLSITGYSQIKSQEYAGDYPFIYRIINENHNPKSLSMNYIKEIIIKGSIWPEFKILFIKKYDSQGNLLKAKSKPLTLKSKLLRPWYWITTPLRHKYAPPMISEIDSTSLGHINYIKYGTTQENYYYNQNMQLIRINVDYNGGFSTLPKIKEVLLDYDVVNNLTLEKIIWIAGDSSIARHYYIDNQIVKSIATKYYFENIQLSENEYTWRIAENPRIETFQYNYLPTGLLDYIKIIDEQKQSSRQILFEYK